MSRRETSFCVYTTMIGRYENLNEQPIAKSSGVPFICLTDDETLVSDSWTIRLVTPCFPSDPVRSQREVKIRPQLHLPDFPASFYIDNSILLTETPELIWERYGTGASGISLPSHSDRESVLDEFLAVTAAGLDDTARVYEQLNHYQLDNYGVLEERPYWTAIMLREIDGLSYEEIAEMMDCPIGTVRSRIFRAREAIAGKLKPLLDTGPDRRW